MELIVSYFLFYILCKMRTQMLVSLCAFPPAPNNISLLKVCVLLGSLSWLVL